MAVIVTNGAAFAMISATEAKERESLGWKIITEEEFRNLKKPKAEPAPVVEKPVESDTMDAQPARRVGRPRKYE
jgi:hypothetical protein